MSVIENLLRFARHADGCACTKDYNAGGCDCGLGAAYTAAHELEDDHDARYQAEQKSFGFESALHAADYERDEARAIAAQAVGERQAAEAEVRRLREQISLYTKQRDRAEAGRAEASELLKKVADRAAKSVDDERERAVKAEDELAAARERYAAQVDDLTDEANRRVAEAEKALAESQARERALRAILDDRGCEPDCDTMHNTALDMSGCSCRTGRALAAPTDDTALREFGLNVAKRVSQFDRQGETNEAAVDVVLRGEP